MLYTHATFPSAWDKLFIRIHVMGPPKNPTKKHLHHIKFHLIEKNKHGNDQTTLSWNL